MGNLVTLLEDSSGIARITLNDPTNLNAMSEEMALDFQKAIQTLALTETKPRVIILSGSGKAFSSGGHLEMLEKKRILSGEHNRQLMRKFYKSFLQVLDLGCPLVASINGSAIGAGLCLACACDLRVASEDAKFGFTFTKLGLHPGMGATYFVPRVVGTAKACELLLTSRVINATEALACGLVSQIVPSGDLTALTDKIAVEIAGCGPEATRQLLFSLRNRPLDLDSSLEREAVAQSINYSGKEFAEGLSAVREKRPAKF